MKKQFFFVILTALCAVLIGCGGQQAGPVQGGVTKPVSSSIIVLQPTATGSSLTSSNGQVVTIPAVGQSTIGSVLLALQGYTASLSSVANQLRGGDWVALRGASSRQTARYETFLRIEERQNLPSCLGGGEGKFLRFAVYDNTDRRFIHDLGFRFYWKGISPQYGQLDLVSGTNLCLNTEGAYTEYRTFTGNILEESFGVQPPTSYYLADGLFIILILIAI